MKFAFSGLLAALVVVTAGTTSAQDAEGIASAGPLAASHERPAEFALRRAHGTDIDLRNLPKTKPVKRERPEYEEPDLNPRELPGGPKAAAPVPVPGPTAIAPAPTANFDGLDFATWGAGHPPDTNGDVGPTYYIQTVNTAIGIYNKSNGSQVAAFTFDTLMSQGNFGNLCDTDNFGDPVVLYDTFEDRWVITDFAFQLSGGNVIAPAFECFAVSKSGDPVTGGWNFYSVNISGGLNDYPKFGVWPDGIYMAANMFGFGAGGGYQNPRVYAFNKAQMYAGEATAQILSFNAPSADFTLLPSNARLQTGTPPSGTPNYFVSTWEFTNALTVYKFHVDWEHPLASTFSGPDTPVAATSWPNAGVANAPSLGGNALDVLQIRAMMQNQYTNIAGAESLWTTHTVRRFDTSGFAAPRWYQVGVTGTTVAANTTQAATWDPDGANVMNRFIPSLAVDRAGDMALGYTTSSSTTKPALKYAGRLAADPLNTFGQTEQLLIQGTGTQTGNCGASACTRWGDYSAMTLDPNGCTFWYTAEYYAVDGLNDLTRIGSFSYPSCTPVGAGGTLSGTVTRAVGGAPLSGAVVKLGSRTTTTNAAGFYSFAALPAGKYPTLSATFPGCLPGTAVDVAVSDASTTTKNFALGNAVSTGCLTDTALLDFQRGTPVNLDLTTSAGQLRLAAATLPNQSNETLSNSGGGITTTTYGGQTFTPSASGPLTSIDVNLFCSGCTGTTPNLTVSLRATSGGLPTGADLATASIAGFSSGSGVYYTATFGTPLTVAAGTQYALVIRPDTNPSPGTYALTRSGSDVYAGGTRVSGATSGTAWSIPTTSGASTDAGFHLYITTGYPGSGNIISGLMDANPAPGHLQTWTTLSWTATKPANTNVQFQVAGSNSDLGPFNFIGPDGTAATFYSTSGASLSQFNGKRYVKYQAYLSTTNAAATPLVDDVTLCFDNPCIPATTPTVTPQSATTFCAGGSVMLQSSSASGNQWYVNGSPIGGATSQQYAAAASGNYTDVVTNEFSCPSAASTAVTVTVNPIPSKPTITPNGPTTFFTGGSVKLSSSTATGNQWYLNGNPIGGATSQDYTASASGNYTVAVTSLSCAGAASDATTVTVQLPPDLSITNTDGATTARPGGATTYTITASNAGPNNATGATVTDAFPAGLTCSWTCVGAAGSTCAASGTGNISDSSVNLPSGKDVTYTAICSISAAATGTLTNTASVAEPPGAIDPTPANNSATDSDALVKQANLSLTLTDNRARAKIGQSIDYVINVANPAGLNDVTATVTDALPAGLVSATWVCTPSGGANCAAGAGSTLSDLATLPAGSQASYVYSASVVSGDASDQLINTASVAVTNGTDPVPANNSATDTDVVVIYADGFEGTPLTVPNEVGSGASYVTATLSVDASLLDTLGIVPVAVASGRGADGSILFTLELARFGSATAIRVVTPGSNGVSQRSSWQTVDLEQRLLAFGWQSGSLEQADGYLSVSTASSSPVFQNLGGHAALTQLWVTVENSVPWLILVGH